VNTLPTAARAIGGAVLGTRASMFLEEWTLHRRQLAPPKT
jgi:hypothetical protein